MNLVGILDAISALAFGLALVGILRQRRLFLAFSPLLLLLAAMGLGLLGSISNTLAFLDVSTFMEQYEGYYEVLFVPLFIFFMYSYGSEKALAQEGETQKALAESEERLRAILEASPEPVVVYDPQGRATFVNPAFTRVFGWSHTELLGRRIDFVPPEEEDKTKSQIQELFASGGPSSFETRRRSKGGQVLDVFISAAAIRDEASRVTGMVVSLTDLTGQKQMEAQLRQSQKMEAIGTLAGGVAHDFNNILGAITGYAELSLGQASSEGPLHESLLYILNAAERASDLTRRILTFSRRKEQELEPLDINAVVEHTVGLLSRVIPRMIEIDLRLAPQLWPVKGEETGLNQIVMNLGSNAKDAMTQGGRLLIQTENLEVDGQRCTACGTVFAGNYVRLRVADNGQGIPPEVLEHIFEPFFTTKELGEGTGLGLSTVFGLAKSYGGHILCNSQPGSGTTFDLYLPALDPSQVPSEAATNSRDLPGGQETILLVDDEEMIRDIGARFLGPKGYQVLTAASGEQALEIFKARVGEIPLVLMDYSMPGMGGGRCLEEMRRLAPELKVIVISGYELGAQGYGQSRPQAFLRKPFKRGQILRMVRQVLDGEPAASWTPTN